MIEIYQNFGVNAQHFSECAIPRLLAGKNTIMCESHNATSIQLNKSTFN